MKKSNLVKLGLAALMASVYSSSATAEFIAGDAIANVITPLTLAATAQLVDFGDVAGGSSAGTVTMTAAGVMGATGGTTSLASGPGTPGGFTIQGEAARAYTLTVTGTATLTDPGNTVSMTADTFVHNAGALTGGVDAFQVGGTLNVGANQAAFAYSTQNPGGATFTLTANYN